MPAPFDGIAGQYDHDFSYTLVGKAQRDIVWQITEKYLPKNPVNILEINCGTGVDALWLANKGHQVVATDASAAMLAETVAKTKNITQVSTCLWDLTQALPAPIGKQDVVFSNFGGLNCLGKEQLSALFRKIDSTLNAGGVTVLVIMGRFCLMESLYFLLTGKWGSIFRRTKKQVVSLSPIDNVETYYYTPHEIKNMLPDHWKCISVQAVGTVIPPSYLNPICVKYPRIFSLLVRLDRICRKLPFAAYASDHYCMVIEKQHT